MKILSDKCQLRHVSGSILVHCLESYVTNKTFKRVSNNLMKLLRTKLCSLCTNHEKIRHEIRFFLM